MRLTRCLLRQRGSNSPFLIWETSNNNHSGWSFTFCVCMSLFFKVSLCVCVCVFHLWLNIVFFKGMRPRFHMSEFFESTFVPSLSLPIFRPASSDKTHMHSILMRRHAAHTPLNAKWTHWRRCSVCTSAWCGWECVWMREGGRDGQKKKKNRSEEDFVCMCMCFWL